MRRIYTKEQLGALPSLPQKISNYRRRFEEIEEIIDADQADLLSLNEHDCICDGGLDNVEDRVICEQMWKIARKVGLSKLDEKVIVERIYEGKTLEEIGDELKCSRENVRRRQERALMKFRRASWRIGVTEYYRP